MRILHLVRELQDRRALETASAQLKQGHQVTLLLLHDAVLDHIDFPDKILACADDVQARGGNSSYATLDYTQVVTAIFDHDRVISW